MNKDKDKDEPLYATKEMAGEIMHCFNSDFTRLANIHMIAEEVLLCATGNLVLMLNVNTGKIDSWVTGKDGGGIGAVCVHPSKKFFAVAEKVGSQSLPGAKPHTYIYTYPEKELVKTLSEGTEQFYTAANFSGKGDKLATIGGDPDFMLTVWRWEDESVILRFKAWGSEVFRVTFNQYDDGFLTSSGNGHIKFWEMAKTFTGLKLQGAIGKFGKTDIQDIVGYTELPDGKVLSGSTSGDLLMWEGNLLKVEVKRNAGDHAVFCHEGPIEVVKLLEEEQDGVAKRVFLSAGNDGYMRYWRFGDIDMVDATDGLDGCAIDCVKEILVSAKCKIRHIDRTPTKWIIQDANGNYWSTPILSMDQVFDEAYTPLAAESKLLLSSHSGSITCVEASPVDYTCVTAGSDGSVRLWDILTNSQIFVSQFTSPFTVLQWLPKAADDAAALIVAGFANGACRVLRRTRTEFQLCQFVKPHTDGVTSISFSADYKWVATTSSDGSIFFFTVNDIATKWTPVGESCLPSPATTSFWENNRVVVGLENGEVIAVERPDPASIDPEITYIFTCKYEVFRYLQRPKPPEKAVKTKDFEDEGEDEDEEEEDDDVAVEQDVGPQKVNAILRLPKSLGSQMLIAMDGDQSAYTYTGISWCDAADSENMAPEDPMTNVAHMNTVVLRMRLSPMGTYLLLGCGNGTILLRDALGGEGATPLKRCYHMNLGHDGRPEVRQGGICLPGTVMGVTMSFDESILITVSEDGSFLTHRLTGIEGAAEPPPVTQVDKEAWPLPLPLDVKDVSDTNALSIQQMKDKEDKDRAFAAAQKKKMSLNDKVKALQVEYQAIVDINTIATQGKKMNKEELELDPEITQLLHDDNERKIMEVVNKYAHETARADLSKRKLEKTYIDCLQIDRIELHAFASGKQVASFRTPELTERQKEQIAEVHALIMNENSRNKASEPVVETTKLPLSPASDALASSAAAQPQATPLEQAATPPETPPLASPDPSQAATITFNDTAVSTATKKKEKSHVKSQLEKAEERKRQRMERKALHDELLSKRPSADQEDPRDLAAIQRAERGMGDKKLKTDPNYIVKETERVTAERKERQLILLEESITTLRLDFNERFLAMRDLKERLVGTLNRDLAKIDEINTQLSEDAKRDPFAMKDCEVPDKLRLETPTRDQLQSFERERDKARRKAEREAKAKSGFGGDLGGADEEEEDDAVDEVDRAIQTRKASLRTHNQRRESHTISAEMRMQLELKGKLERLPKSALEQQEETVRRHKLVFEKQKLERKIQKTVATFDDALDELRREKLKLEGDLKMADIRILLLYRELVLLKEFKKRDEQLGKKLEDHRAEKLEVTKKTNECQERLNQKKVEIKHLLSVEQANMNAMLKLLSGLPQGVRDHLMKIFRKKVKRKTKKNEDEEEEEEEESSDEDWDSNEDEENNEDEEDVCPDGCEEDVYEEVLALRLKRLDQEDVVLEFQKSMDQLKKENEQLTRREKQTNTKLQQVEKEIQEFQTEKQQKLNQLETSIVLKLSQVQALNAKKKLPHDQTNLVVFTNSGMRDLFSRIGQLQTDKKVLNREHNEHKRTHCQLYKEKKVAEAHVKEWEQKVFEVQLLKFGQKVDLESLEDVSVDRKTEELKEKLREEEILWDRAMRVQMQALKKLKQQQQQAISTNSKLLKELADMRHEQHRLEDQLNVSQHKILSRMAGGSRIATAADRANLKDLVVMQQREIDALKSEVAMLRRKGGHVYTPVVSKVVTADAAGDNIAPPKASTS